MASSSCPRARRRRSISHATSRRWPSTPRRRSSIPPALFDQGIEGTVILRLYADTAGVLINDSTRVQESSGFPALDSAAVAAAPNLRFAPARRDGKPVAASFLQPIYFRHPGVGGTTP